MKHRQVLIMLTAACCSINSVCYSQVSSDYAVQLTAEADTAVPCITLHWPLYSQATGYTIYKKAKTYTSWGGIYATLAGTDTAFTDNNVTADTAYEYRVIRQSPSIYANGYIYAGINLQPDEYKGKLILLADSSFSDSLAPEINRLMKDISGDGWAVVKYDVSPTDSVPDVKALIVNEYNNDPLNIKAVFLLGHVPVPYSGDINPDGHTDHLGAWPADVYYGDVNGNYTDNSVNDASASRIENRNIPGDGKFDQSIIPSQVELQVGRVDMHNLPSFALSEKELLKRYLDKDHSYRNKLFVAANRGLIDDNFGAFNGEAFASCGWRNFAPLIGTGEIQETDFFTTLNQNSYLWSYACGGGWYQGASGIGSTTDFAADTVQTIFTMIFGSYFGDWDSQDNFMRAAIASYGSTLTSCWAGRPYWHFHHMASGENIGYCTMLAQNNGSLYVTNYAARYVHISLMGDPTLKMHIIAPPSNISVTNPGQFVLINWDASPDTVQGYYIYRSLEEFGIYSRISPAIINDLSYTDIQPQNGLNYYMVRAVRLEKTPSGSFYNLSKGIADSISVDINQIDIVHAESPQLIIYPNPCKDRLYLRMINYDRDASRIEIYDPVGHIVHIKNIRITSGDYTCMLNLGSVNPGVYIVKVINSNSAKVNRIALSP